MSNRSKHLSNNFETRQVFSTENANLNIVQPFNDVINPPDFTEISVIIRHSSVVQFVKVYIE